jgi:hypothetical protein
MFVFRVAKTNSVVLGRASGKLRCDIGVIPMPLQAGSYGGVDANRILLHLAPWRMAVLAA